MASNSTDINWRTNNKVEPFKMISNSPTQTLPSQLFCPKAIEEERMNRIKKAKIPDSASCDFWENIYSGGVGTTDPHLLSPSFDKIIGSF